MWKRPRAGRQVRLISSGMTIKGEGGDRPQRRGARNPVVGARSSNRAGVFKDSRKGDEARSVMSKSTGNLAGFSEIQVKGRADGGRTIVYRKQEDGGTKRRKTGGGEQDHPALVEKASEVRRRRGKECEGT